MGRGGGLFIPLCWLCRVYVCSPVLMHQVHVPQRSAQQVSRVLHVPRSRHVTAPTLQRKSPFVLLLLLLLLLLLATKGVIYHEGVHESVRGCRGGGEA
jgi:hypothetical protein